MEDFLPDTKTLRFKKEIYHFAPALGKIADEVLVNTFDNINRVHKEKQARDTY